MRSGRSRTESENVDTAPARADRLARSLENIRQAPLHRLPPDHVANVVQRLVAAQSESATINVAAFSSAV